MPFVSEVSITHTHPFMRCVELLRPTGLIALEERRNCKRKQKQKTVALGLAGGVPNENVTNLDREEKEHAYT